jgi:hypothetical protein
MMRPGFGGLATSYDIMRQPGIQVAIDARFCRSWSVLQVHAQACDLLPERSNYRSLMSASFVIYSATTQAASSRRKKPGIAGNIRQIGGFEQPGNVLGRGERPD